MPDDKLEFHFASEADRSLTQVVLTAASVVVQQVIPSKMSITMSKDYRMTGHGPLPADQRNV